MFETRDDLLQVMQPRPDATRKRSSFKLQSVDFIEIESERGEVDRLNHLKSCIDHCKAVGHSCQFNICENMLVHGIDPNP